MSYRHTKLNILKAKINKAKNIPNSLELNMTDLSKVRKL